MIKKCKNFVELLLQVINTIINNGEEEVEENETNMKNNIFDRNIKSSTLGEDKK